MRTKPYCNAPWIGLSYESSVGCKPCCEYIGGIESGSAFKGRYTDYIKSDYLKDFKKMTKKERVLAALNRKEVDRPPIALSLIHI